MCPGEGSGGGSGGGGGGGPGDSGGGDIGAILAYLNHWSFGTDGDYTGNAGYGGDNIGPVGSKEPEKDEDRSTALIDALMVPPGKIPGGPQRPGNRNDRSREIEPYGGGEMPTGSLFAFAGADVDVYSGVPLGIENPDPFTGLPASDPFADAEWPTRAPRAARFATLRQPSLLSSPYLLADNDVIACDPYRTSCLPNVKSDFNQSSLANSIQAEMDESNAAIQPFMEGKAKIVGNTELDMYKVASKAEQVARSDEYKLAYTVNQLRDHPLEIRHSASLTDLAARNSVDFADPSGLTKTPLGKPPNSASAEEQPSIGDHILDGLGEIPGSPFGLRNNVKTLMAMAKAFNAEKSLGGGVAMAVNVLNPLYHAEKARFQSGEAADRGEYGNAATYGVQAAVGYLQTLAMAAGVARDIVRPGPGLAPPAAPASSAPKYRLPIIDPHVATSVPPEASIQGATKAVAERLRSNPELVPQYLSPGELKNWRSGQPWRMRMAFGNAVERAVARGAEPTGFLTHVGDIRPAALGSPDIIGVAGTPFEGKLIQITTEKGYYTHVENAAPETIWGLHTGP
jgi:hypothetical protein